MLSSVAAFSSLQLRGRREGPLELLGEGWKIVGYRAPDDVEVDVEVAVNEAVAHRDDVLPGDVGPFHPGRCCMRTPELAATIT